MQQAPVFEQTYQNYLTKIRGVDYLARADLLGGRVENSHLIIPLYDRHYAISGEGISALAGDRVSVAVRVILCKYVLSCPAELPQTPGPLRAYREFRGAAPLVSYFEANVHKVIEDRFAGELAALRASAMACGGKELVAAAYDLSVQFSALPRIPVLLNFNDRDELFPPSCSLLFRASAAHYLDMECLAMTATLLGDRLTQ